MKVKYIIAGIIMLMSLSGCSTRPDNDRYLKSEGIVPQPVAIEKHEGAFIFTKSSVWTVENKDQADIAKQLISMFARAAGFEPNIEIKGEKGDIVFVTDTTIAKEGYVLDITKSDIEIKASGKEGFFYAVQTIRQLLPATIESATLDKSCEWSVPALTIKDEPRFGYRGLMLDVARFFIPKQTVLKIIDCAAMLKVNKLHFHLVDDNGWRLEIKKYPKLTEIGAWRVKRDGPFSARRNPEKGEETPVGGFYTQEDMKEIIDYAMTRQIEIIPEIEMPAHTNSSLAAYPQLACPVVKDYIGVLPGLGGTNSVIIYCAGNDSVFTFLENVMDEVVELFPSEYIHLGGDEAVKENWKKCSKCQARMRTEHIKNEEELQGYFMKRMSKYVHSKGKKVMGWDELTNAELPDEVTIFGWQGFGTAALKAARQGHEFIMTPARIMYLIRYQGPQWFEPVTYFGNNTLKDVYNYEPIQEDWEPQVVSLLKGVQASLWTEFCNAPEDTEYLLFPRLAALAEVAWSPEHTKDWDGFLKRLDPLTEHWSAMGINYAHSMFNIDHNVRPSDGKLKIALSCIRPDVEIRYTMDGSQPTLDSQLYQDTLVVDQKVFVRAATFMNNELKGKVLDLNLNWNKATGKKGVGNDTGNRVYVLTNGLRGSEKYTDFEWAGWYNQDASFVVDLAKKEQIHKITLGCITNYGMAVHIPSEIKIFVSDDGVKYTCVSEKKYSSEDIFREGTRIEDKVFDRLSVEGRYIKIEMKNPGICPPNHIRPGQNIWMYFDEIIVE